MQPWGWAALQLELTDSEPVMPVQREESLSHAGPWQRYQRDCWTRGGHEDRRAVVVAVDAGLDVVAMVYAVWEKRDRYMVSERVLKEQGQV